MTASGNLVEVWVGGSPRSVGVGVLVSNRLVLTGADVGSPNSSVQIALPGSDARIIGRRVWPAADVPSAGALVEITDRMPAAPLRWGVLCGHGAWVEATIAGATDFPIEVNNFAIQDDGCWQPRQGQANDFLTPQQEWPVPGSPVFCGPMLIGLLGYGIGGSADPLVVPVARLLADNDFSRLIQEDAGRAPRLEPVDLGAVMRPWSPEAGPGMPTALLSAEHEVVPFEGRERTVDRITRWCASALRQSALLLTGPAGQGKRRSARHIADTLRVQDWVVGELAREPVSGWQDAITRSRLPLLLIVDDARRRAADLSELAATLTARGAGAPIRVLLLATDAGPWWTRLVESAPDLFDQPPESLADLEFSSLELTGHLRRATEAFARFSGPTRWLPDMDGHATGNMLALHMAALAQVLDDATTEHGRRAEDVVLEHEIRAWQRASATLSLEARSFWQPALTAALLFGASNEGVALQTLRMVPGLNAAAAGPVHRELAAWIRELYPPVEAEGEFWGTLRLTAMRADYMAGECADSRLLEAALPAVEPDQARSALLLLLSVDDPALHNRLGVLVAAHPRMLAPETASLANESPAALELLQRLLADGRTDLSEPLCQAMLGQIPTSEGALGEIRLSLHDRMIASFRRAVESGSARARPELALQLNNSASTLAAMGRHADAISRCQDAVQEYRHLAGSGPNRAAFLTPLAESLLLLAEFFAGDQRATEAADSAGQAAALYRGAVASADSQLRPRLASTLELFARLTEDGSRAVPALREAAEIHRWSASPPATGDVGARALANLTANLSQQAETLWESGQPDAAQHARVEAVNTSRRLALARPGEYRRLHLSCLEDLARTEFAMGRQDAGLGSMRQVLSLWRQEAEEHQASGLAPLAAAAQTLSDRLADAGRHQAALEAAQEAVSSLSLLIRGRAGIGADLLAAAQHTLGVRLAEMGRWKESFEPTNQAIATLHGLVQGGHRECVIRLAGALTNMSATMAAGNRHAEANRAAQDAVSVLSREDVQPADRELHTRVLAGAKTNAANALRHLARHAEGLRVAREAVALQQSIGDVPADELGRPLGLLRDLLLGQDQAAEAVMAAEQVVAIYRDAAQHRPDAYGLAHTLALHELARCLLAARQLPQGVECARRAAEGYARQAGDSPRFDDDRADVAMLLSSCLAEQGFGQEAAVAAGEAVAIYRQRAGQGVRDESGKLADALDAVWGLSNIDPQTRLKYAQEAVALRRQLAADSEPVRIALLAQALQRLARQHALVGHLPKGLHAAEEAVTQSRRLQALEAPQAPAVLAESLLEWSWQLASAGREAESLGKAADAANEAAVGYRALGEPRNLALALIDLSHRQMALEDPMSALLSAQEAVAVLEDDSPVDRPLLAEALARVDLCLIAAGDEPGRLLVAERRVAIFAELSEEDHSFANEHAVALRRLSGVQAGSRTLARRRAAAAAAVEIHTWLAAQDHVRFDAELADSLRSRAAVLPRFRQRAEKKRLRSEAAKLDRN